LKVETSSLWPHRRATAGSHNQLNMAVTLRAMRKKLVYSAGNPDSHVRTLLRPNINIHVASCIQNAEKRQPIKSAAYSCPND